MTWFYHQHMPQISPQGTLVLFDNRTFSASPFAPPLPPALAWTRAVEYAINEEQGTVRQLWESEGPAIDGLMTFAMGEADGMPQTGNVLVFYGGARRRDRYIQRLLDPMARAGCAGEKGRGHHS